MEKLCKLLLNSLYGKFAQLSPEWQDLKSELCEEPFDQWPEVDESGNLLGEYRSIGYQVQKKGKQREAGYSSPIVSAWITAAGRMRMQWLRWKIGEEECIYQDTDSLHLTQKGFDRFCLYEPIMLDELGGFKLEGIYQEGHYLGQRHYRLDDQWIIAGKPSKSTLNPDGSWTFDEFSRLSTIVNPSEEAGVLVARQTKKFAFPRVGGTITGANLVIPIDLRSGKKSGKKCNKSLDFSI